jgi:hypothetical protein
VPSGGSTQLATPVQLTGAGSDDPGRELLTWQKELYGTKGKLNLSYDTVGDLTGRQVYINGLSNYVISGQPFTASDLSRLQGGASSIIAAPVMASALGFLVMWSPTFTLQRSCAQGDTSCQATSTYTGQLNVPTTALTDMLWPSIGGESCGCFTDPGIIAATEPALPQGRDTAPPTLTTPYEAGVRPLTLMRADPSETNYATQQFATVATPGEFAKLPHFHLPITEYLQGEPLSGVATLDGLANELTYVSSTIEQGGGASGPAAGFTDRGIVLPAPPSAITGLDYTSPPGVPTAAAPPSPARWIGVQNADGDYVAPSPASIDAAINAGGSTPLYALSHPVGGATPAYPLTYVDDLYAPAQGLSADQAEAMATLIRYLATAGQDAMAAQGDGQLSPPLVAQALAAANQVIASNCTQPDEQVVINSETGRYAPTLGPMDGKTAAQRQAEMQGGAPMLHCVYGVTQTAIAPPPPVPSSTPPTAPGAAGGSQPAAGSAGAPSQVTSTGSATGGALSAPPASSASSAPGSSPAAAAAAQNGASRAGSRRPILAGPVKTQSQPGHQAPGPVTLLNLPLPLPGPGTPGLNRLVGFLLGAGAFLLLWRYRRALLRPLGL